ncbi:translation initiation factor IF-2-like [Coturnix japonica]|uniref:translation initiation factor IF-2-like n=1 Tax=Coturnix japonica TaxID=93934 RepID=UPI0013A5EDD5|nr:translation initiation factor IF-2-like [Coturnix japonica]
MAGERARPPAAAWRPPAPLRARLRGRARGNERSGAERPPDEKGGGGRRPRETSVRGRPPRGLRAEIAAAGLPTMDPAGLGAASVPTGPGSGRMANEQRAAPTMQRDGRRRGGGERAGGGRPGREGGEGRKEGGRGNGGRRGGERATSAVPYEPRPAQRPPTEGPRDPTLPGAGGVVGTVMCHPTGRTGTACRERPSEALGPSLIGSVRSESRPLWPRTERPPNLPRFIEKNS